MNRTLKKIFKGFPILATILLAIYGAFLPELRSIVVETPEKAALWQEVLWHWRVGLFALIGLIAIGGQILHHVLGSRRRSVKFFLDHLHRKAWGQRRGRDPDYRVALFVPRRLPCWRGSFPWIGTRTVLRCYYRTDGRRPRKTWSKEPPKERVADGVVGCAWLHGFEPEVPALPEDPSEQEIEEYCRHTYVPREEYDERSWPGAAMKATLVDISAVDEPIGVLLVECKLPEMQIEMPHNFVYEAEVCGLIWQGLL